MRHSVRTFFVARHLPGGPVARRRAGAASIPAAGSRAKPVRDQSRDYAAMSGAPSALRGPRFHRAHHRQGNRRGRKTDRGGAVERSGVRARVRHDPARHLQDHRADSHNRYDCRSTAGASSAPTEWSKGSVRRTGNTFQVEMRLFNVRARGVALGRVYDNVSLRNPRAARARHVGRHSPDPERV